MQQEDPHDEPALEWVIDPKRACPCGNSTRLARECCLFGATLEPKEPCLDQLERPRAFKWAHPGCYARALGDCSSRISGEHFVSKAALAVIASDRGQLEVSGLPWQKGTTKTLTLDALQANVLCEHHNRSLSGLDVVGERLTSGLAKIAAVIRSGADGRDLPPLVLHGHAFERWLLKILCGTIASGNAGHDRHVPERWVRILFGLEPFPSSWGMWIKNRLDEAIKGFGQNRYGMAVMRDGDEYVGLRMQFFGLQVTLITHDTNEAAMRTFAKRRPMHLRFVRGAASVAIVMHWRYGSSPGTGYGWFHVDDEWE